MGASTTQVRCTETTLTSTTYVADEAWATFESASGGVPRAGMLRLGRAAGRPWSFAAFGTAAPGAHVAEARRAPARAETVVLRVRSLTRTSLDDGGTRAFGEPPVTLVGATN